MKLCSNRARGNSSAPKPKVVSIGVNDLYIKSNYQDFQRYPVVDLSISGDGEATLPALIEAVKSALSNERKTALAARIDPFRKAHAAGYEASRQAAVFGWDSSPVSTSRLCMEIWQAIKAEDWSLVSVGASESFFGGWPHRLWHFDKHYQYLGYGAAGGVGYGLPASVGAALANKALGRFSVNIQCDGDFMYANGALWTAAHHRIPLLTVMHNNRAYAAETMLLQGMANKRGRGIDTAKIGTRDRRSADRLRQGCPGPRRLVGGTDHRSEPARRRSKARRRGGQEGRTRPGRRRNAIALNEVGS